MAHPCRIVCLSEETTETDRLPAVADGHLYEVRSSLILQPGPAALTDGLAALEAIVERWRSASARAAALRPPALSCAS